MGKKEDYMKIIELEVKAAINETDHLPSFYRDMVFTQFKIPESMDSTQKPADEINGSKRKNRVYPHSTESTFSNIS